MKPRGGDFNRGYANKSGQEREGKAKRKALNVQMKWKGRWEWFSQAAEGKPVERRVEHYEKQWNDRPKLHVGDRFIIATRPRSRLNKAGPHFSRFLAKSCPATRALSSLCLFKPSIILLLLLASRTVEAVNAGPIEPNVIY